MIVSSLESSICCFPRPEVRWLAPAPSGMSSGIELSLPLACGEYDALLWDCLSEVSVCIFRWSVLSLFETEMCVEIASERDSSDDSSFEVVTVSGLVAVSGRRFPRLSTMKQVRDKRIGGDYTMSK